MGQLRFAWDETEALIRATARVERADGAGGWKAVGTAFFVAPGKLLTCAHVATREHPSRIVWHGESGRHELAVTIEQRVPDDPAVDPYPTPDVVLLAVDGVVPEHPTVWLDTAEPGEDLWAFGYPKEYNEYVALGNPARFRPTGSGETEEAGGWVYKLKANRLRGGMSGSPLLDLKTGRVVGMIKRTLDSQQALGGYAVPMTAIFDALPGLREANEEASPQARASLLAATLWGKLLRQATGVLEQDAAVCETVAEELGLPTDADPAAVARELFLTDLDTVSTCATIVCNMLGPDPAQRLFEVAAVCASYEGEPWISPTAAAELELQVERLAVERPTRGRVLRLRSGSPEIRELYCRRGDRRRRWRPPLGPTVFSHDDVDGMPQDFETSLRIEAARKAKRTNLAALELTPEDAEQWQKLRPALLADLQKFRVVGLLPIERIDKALVDQLVSRFPIAFLVATSEEATPEVAAHADYQELEPDIDDERAARALLSYNMALGYLA